MLLALLAFTATPVGEGRGYSVPEEMQALPGCLRRVDDCKGAPCGAPTDLNETLQLNS